MEPREQISKINTACEALHSLILLTKDTAITEQLLAGLECLIIARCRIECQIEAGRKP